MSIFVKGKVVLTSLPGKDFVVKIFRDPVNLRKLFFKRSERFKLSSNADVLLIIKSRDFMK